jgi:dienelactone hydrolase
MVCTGGDDPRVPVEQVLAFEDEMRQAGVDWQVITYGGAQHAFTIPAADSWGRPGAKYNRLADQRSWRAMESFLAEAFDVAPPG